MRQRQRLRNIRKPVDLVIAYDDGFEGVYADPEQNERFVSEMTYSSGADAAAAFGWADKGKGKLVVPFKNIEALYPTAMPGPAQRRGDCVSHSTKNAALGTMCCDVMS